MRSSSRCCDGICQDSLGIANVKCRLEAQLVSEKYVGTRHDQPTRQSAYSVRLDILQYSTDRPETMVLSSNCSPAPVPGEVPTFAMIETVFTGILVSCWFSEYFYSKIPK